jgi:hypothetical protein
MSREQRDGVMPIISTKAVKVAKDGEPAISDQNSEIKWPFKNRKRVNKNKSSGIYLQ